MLNCGCITDLDQKPQSFENGKAMAFHPVIFIQEFEHNGNVSVLVCP